jgi:hypothetical protein
MMPNSELRVARRLCLLVLGLYLLSFILPVTVFQGGHVRGYVLFLYGLKSVIDLGVGVDEASVVAPAWFANFVFWYGSWALWHARWRAAAWAGFFASVPSLLCGWILIIEWYDHDSRPGLSLYLWLSSMVLLLAGGIYGTCKFAVPSATANPAD